MNKFKLVLLLVVLISLLATTMLFFLKYNALKRDYKSLSVEYEKKKELLSDAQEDLNDILFGETAKKLGIQQNDCNDIQYELYNVKYKLNLLQLCIKYRVNHENILQNSNLINDENVHYPKVMGDISIGFKSKDKSNQIDFLFWKDIPIGTRMVIDIGNSKHIFGKLSTLKMIDHPCGESINPFGVVEIDSSDLNSLQNSKSTFYLVTDKYNEVGNGQKYDHVNNYNPPLSLKKTLYEFLNRFGMESIKKTFEEMSHSKERYIHRKIHEEIIKNGIDSIKNNFNFDRYNFNDSVFMIRSIADWQNNNDTIALIDVFFLVKNDSIYYSKVDLDYTCIFNEEGGEAEITREAFFLEDYNIFDINNDGLVELGVYSMGYESCSYDIIKFSNYDSIPRYYSIYDDGL